MRPADVSFERVGVNVMAIAEIAASAGRDHRNGVYIARDDREEERVGHRDHALFAERVHPRAPPAHAHVEEDQQRQREHVRGACRRDPPHERDEREEAEIGIDADAGIACIVATSSSRIVSSTSRGNGAWWARASAGRAARRRRSASGRARSHWDASAPRPKSPLAHRDGALIIAGGERGLRPHEVVGCELLPQREVAIRRRGSSARDRRVSARGLDSLRAREVGRVDAQARRAPGGSRVSGAGAAMGRASIPASALASPALPGGWSHRAPRIWKQQAAERRRHRRGIDVGRRHGLAPGGMKPGVPTAVPGTVACSLSSDEPLLTSANSASDSPTHLRTPQSST